MTIVASTTRPVLAGAPGALHPQYVVRRDPVAVESGGTHTRLGVHVSPATHPSAQRRVALVVGKPLDDASGGGRPPPQ